jgi:hypothetical protein
LVFGFTLLYFSAAQRKYFPSPSPAFIANKLRQSASFPTQNQEANHQAIEI